MGGGQFGGGVNGRGNGVAVEHLCTLQDLQGILLLRQEQTIMSSVNIDAQEMVDVTKITHGELRMK
jgi:hypothetical protein